MGFVALDPTRPYLYLARRENGLGVFDVKRQRLVKTLANSAGANGVVQVPGLDRLFVLNTDGSLSVVERSSLKVLKRIAVAQSNLNSAVYEPATGQVIIVSGRRADRSSLFVFDPRQERVTAAHELDVKKIDPLLVKGDGSFFLPMRDEGKVARLSAKTFEVLDSWQFDGCVRPSALAQDSERRRLFVACRGDQPRLVVAGLDSGVPKASLPITRDVNALAYDSAGRRLLVPSGVDANLTLVRQDDADHYALLGVSAPCRWPTTWRSTRRAARSTCRPWTSPCPPLARTSPRPTRSFTRGPSRSPPWHLNRSCLSASCPGKAGYPAWIPGALLPHNSHR